MNDRPSVRNKRVVVEDFLEPGNMQDRDRGTPPPPIYQQDTSMGGDTMQNSNQSQQQMNNNQSQQQMNNNQPPNNNFSHLEKNAKKNKGKKDKGKSAPNKLMIIFATLVLIASILILGFVGNKMWNQYKLTGSPFGPTTQGTIEDDLVEDDGQSVDVNGSIMPSVDGGTGNTDAIKPGVDDATGETVDNTLKPGTNAPIETNPDGTPVKPGMNNPKEDTTMKQESDVESDLMVKDLRGISLIPNYSVTEVKTVTDFVNYKKHRAITDDGMELLWLEVDYKEKNYKITVPFKIFKELDPNGITVVDMEVLDLGNGNEVISYMRVRDDYKSKLENGLR